MSLYEQFFSETNKEYMYSLIGKIVDQKYSIDVLNDDNNYETFLSDMKDIFDNNDLDNISDINKLLLDKQVDKYKDKTAVVVNNDMERPNNLDEMMKMREQDVLSVNNIEDDKPKNIFMNTSVIGTSISDLEKVVEEQELEVEEQELEVEEQELEVEEQELLPKYNINSSNRTNVNSSRFNYKINTSKHGIDTTKIKRISKLVIPIEYGNFIFDIPLLSLKIPELNYDIILKQDELITNKKGDFGIYTPIEEVEINVGDDLKQLSIDIRDITETRYDFNDMIKVNIIEIKNNVLILTCSNINHTSYKTNDSIKIINNRSHELFYLLSQPYKVCQIVKNMIFCKIYDEYPDKKYDNIDMRIMNMSNQNVLFIN